VKTKMARLLLVVSIATTTWLFLSAVPAVAQNQDPLIGTWNFYAGGSNPFVFVQTFNAGGTTVEFDSAGTNSSASPGESITLGKWAKTATGKYTFKGENYIYDASGNLVLLAVGNCKLELASTMKHASGPCTVSFYACSVSQCPGTLQHGPYQYSIHGKRF